MRYLLAVALAPFHVHSLLAPEATSQQEASAKTLPKMSAKGVRGEHDAGLPLLPPLWCDCGLDRSCHGVLPVSTPRATVWCQPRYRDAA